MNKSRPPFTNNSNLEKYLTGQLFSNYMKFKFVKKTIIPQRVDIIEQLLKDKVVLHFGCCDHANLIEEKIENNTHLQVKISAIAAKCVGVDNNQEALNKLNSLNIKNCFYYDLYETNDPIIENETYDCVLLGEIMEHIADPVAFLRKMHTKFINAKEIIITVPNAFSTRNFHNIKKGIEEINTDHKYWFTPYTISKVATEAGFKMKSIYFVDRSRLNIPDKIVKWFYLLLNKDPFVSRKWSIIKANGLVIICKF